MSLRVAMVGMGAVGGWYAGLLALAGNEVRCLARTDAETLRRDGLRLRDGKSERRVRFAAVETDPARLGACDLVIVALKATANHRLRELVDPLAKPGATLLTLQNGMGNAEALATLRGPEPAVAGLCFVCINRTAPGVVENSLPGHIRLAAAEGPVQARVRACASLLRNAGVDAREEDSLESVLWRKLCWNIPFNGLAIAAGGVATDRILADPALRARARILMEEVRSAAAARGTPFGEDHVRRQFELTAGMGAYHPSSLIDYLAGREVEVDPIWAVPLARGQSAGAAMPELGRLLAEIRGRLAERDRSARA
jgi:2-dehydropantoate 2-reductase